MTITCTSCRRVFNLGQDWLKYAIERAEKKKHKYSNADCPHCRRNVRVPVDQMKRQVVTDPDETAA